MSSKAKKSATRNSDATPPAKLTGEAPSTALVPMGLPAGVTVVRRLTMPSLVFKKDGEAHVLAIVDALRVSSVPGKKKADGTNEEPATICTVGDVQTGEMFTWLVPSVCKSVFERDYPNGDYVGKAFYVRKDGKREGKRHIDYTVAEVDASALTAQAKS